MDGTKTQTEGMNEETKGPRNERKNEGTKEMNEGMQGRRNERMDEGTKE